MRIRILIAFLSIVILPATSPAQEDRSQEDRTLSPYFLVLSEDPAVDQLPHYSSRRLFSFGVNLDLFTITGSTDGGMINHFAEVDFLFMFPVFSHWNLYLGFGMGLFAPRARFGADLLLFDRRQSGPILKLGGRYILTTWVADTPDDYRNFDAEHDFAHGFMGEAGLGWRFVSGRFALQVVGLYLVGPMWPQIGGEDRASGAVEPDGQALFHGGTISLTFEW